MKFASRFLPIATILLGAAFAVSTFAQQPQGPPPGPGGPPPGQFALPEPTNLKVLPKNTNGQQLRDIMQNWAGSLGVHCNTCHTQDTKNLDPNGRPRMNFADDSKPEKNTARLMYTMVQGINKDYIMKLENVEQPVACGTCHRGHLDPEPFVIPKREHGGPPPGAPPAGAPAPQN
ncbi:MAG: c-type cytochrome [Terracidiphilus sp.]